MRQYIRRVVALSSCRKRSVPGALASTDVSGNAIAVLLPPFRTEIEPQRYHNFMTSPKCQSYARRVMKYDFGIASLLLEPVSAATSVKQAANSLERKFTIKSTSKGSCSL